MAGISSTIRLNDQMSPALRSINKTLNIVLNSFEKMKVSGESSINTKDIELARSELAKAASATNELEEKLDKQHKNREIMEMLSRSQEQKRVD